ncbi:hypothetical protein [Streptomyces rubiginosohelvolus]|uniref:hypothetical protein n=1 Tax=Streptomyces rubiginosohelvolus TaxID=67362 RepID=UPI0035DB95F2
MSASVAEVPAITATHIRYAYPEPSTLGELDSLFRGQMHPVAIPIVLTPALAKLVLRRNTRNRPIRPSTVTDYSRDMVAGAWPLNGEAIKISWNGDVLDGQHRLHACEKAGVSIPTFIVGNLPPEAQNTMDSGLRRTTADVLALGAEENSTTLASILRRVWGWQQGDRKFTRRSSPTKTEAQDLLRATPELRRSAEIAGRTRTAFPHIPQSALGTAHYLFNSLDPDETAWFFQRLADGAELPVGHPILALRTRVTSERAKDGRIPWARHLVYLVTTWNAVREGRTLTRFSVPAGAPVPEPK